MSEYIYIYIYQLVKSEFDMSYSPQILTSLLLYAPSSREARFCTEILNRAFLCALIAKMVDIVSFLT